MVKRISETYEVGQRVEIRLGGRSGGRWVGGLVLRFDFPGVWVRSDEGGQWFVTNVRRIRPSSAVDDGSHSQPDDQ